MSTMVRPVVALALVCGLLLRVFDLERVPAWYTDKGLWSMPARDFVLSGNWFASFDSHYLLSPLYSVILAGAYEVFGPGILQARALNAVLGTATVGLIFVLGRRIGLPVAGAFAALAVAFDGPSIVTSRSAILENLQALLLVACACCAVGGRWRRPLMAVCLCLAVLTKPLSLYAAPAIVAYTWWRFGLGAAIRDGLALALGALAAGAVFVGLALNSDGVFATALARETSVRGLQWLPRGYSDTLVQSAQYTLTRDPILLLLLVAALIWLWRTRLRERNTVFLAVWVLVGVVAMSVQGYSPSRYYVPLFAIAWLCVFAVLLRAVSNRRALKLSVGVLGVQAAFTLVSLVGYYYVQGRADGDSARATTWVNEHAVANEPVLASLRVLVGTRNPSVSQRFVGRERLTADELEAVGVSLVVTVPDATPNEGRATMVQAEPDRYESVADFGQIHVYRLDKARAPSVAVDWPNR